MITKKVWLQAKPTPLGNTYEWSREGWYLFGFIPLYVRDLTARERKR